MFMNIKLSIFLFSRHFSVVFFCKINIRDYLCCEYAAMTIINEDLGQDFDDVMVIFLM